MYAICIYNLNLKKDTMSDVSKKTMNQIENIYN